MAELSGIEMVGGDEQKTKKYEYTSSPGQAWLAEFKLGTDWLDGALGTGDQCLGVCTRVTAICARRQTIKCTQIQLCPANDQYACSTHHADGWHVQPDSICLFNWITIMQIVTRLLALVKHGQYVPASTLVPDWCATCKPCPSVRPTKPARLIYRTRKRAVFFCFEFNF